MKIPPRAMENPLAYWLQATAEKHYDFYVVRLVSVLKVDASERTLPQRKRIAAKANRWARYHDMATVMLKEGVSYID